MARWEKPLWLRCTPRGSLQRLIWRHWDLTLHRRTLCSLGFRRRRRLKYGILRDKNDSELLPSRSTSKPKESSLHSMSPTRNPFAMCKAGSTVFSSTLQKTWRWLWWETSATWKMLAEFSLRKRRRRLTKSDSSTSMFQPKRTTTSANVSKKSWT